MSTKKKSRIPAERIALYEKLLATIPEIERKGADNPYTSLNGNMFSIRDEPHGKMGETALTVRLLDRSLTGRGRRSYVTGRLKNR